VNQPNYAPQIPKASKEVQIVWIRHRTIARAVDGLFSVARTLLRASAWVFVAYFFFLASRAFAGKETKLSGVLDAAFKMSFDRYAAYFGCALFGVSWWRERRLRRKVIEEHAPYISELEKTIDPGRTGSHLLKNGRAQSRDRNAL
jgi:hypothetical protein